MRLTHDITIEQQQKLLITPELRQAIAILQMSTLELSTLIHKELEENPFLEEKEVGEEKEILEQKDYLQDSSDSYRYADTSYIQKGSQGNTFDNFLTRRPSLYEHLEFQLNIEIREPDDLEIGNYLIGSIDQNGYLSIGIDKVAKKLDMSLAKVKKVLKVIHSFHPHGVGARNLEECLLLQLKHYGKDSRLAKLIIANHLNDLAKGRLGKIARVLAASVHEIQDICDLIRTLDPKPGLEYGSSDEVKYIAPDIFVEDIDGKRVVVVNDFNIPRLTINQGYEKILRQQDVCTQDVRKYLEEKMGSAVWLLKSIEQRRTTLYKVACCIIDIQNEFLDKGIEYLKPLKMSQVAELIDVHESTVSRATTNKYIQTCRGLFELKYFFSTGVESANQSQKVSAKSIKHMIEEIIENEDAVQPLSDQAVTKILAGRGISISRRTVAKYRQEMNIPPTTVRRRYDKD